MFELKMPEEVFWETMTPARLCELYTAHFRPRNAARGPNRGGAQPSLLQYLTGGGG